MSTQARLKTANTDGSRLSQSTLHWPHTCPTFHYTPSTLKHFILAEMSCQLTTPLPLCISNKRLQRAGQYGRLYCTTKLSTEQVPSYLLTEMNQTEMTVFVTTSCFVPTQVNSSISQSRKKIPAKLCDVIRES